MHACKPPLTKISRPLVHLAGELSVRHVELGEHMAWRQGHLLEIYRREAGVTASPSGSSVRVSCVYGRGGVPSDAVCHWSNTAVHMDRQLTAS
jgi:hypothetical protein